MDRRDRYPASSFFDTPEGRTWLIRLVVATLFEFGLKRGVGAETRSEFCRRLHLEEQGGGSPSALRTVMHLLERFILDIADAWEKEGIAHGEIRPVSGAVDETFLPRMMLVFMDLATGYLLMEEVVEDRSFDTWYDRANERLSTFGTSVLYMVSDRAKALIKLAHTGLGCPSLPDVFHRWTQWAEALLLPFAYGQEQRHRTRHPGQKAQIALVLQAVEEAFERHPCTRQLKPEVLTAWKAWAADHAKAFQRASSAVEGRNGSLSQMQHNHRGLPMRRYQAWTALHNFDCRATDGTTPASRFFRRSFPDLFESVLSKIDELPMPRQRRQALTASH
jgi:hypothetical protein